MQSFGANWTWSILIFHYSSNTTVIVSPKIFPKNYIKHLVHYVYTKIHLEVKTKRSAKNSSNLKKLDSPFKLCIIWPMTANCNVLSLQTNLTFANLHIDWTIYKYRNVSQKYMILILSVEIAQIPKYIPILRNSCFFVLFLS